MKTVIEAADFAIEVTRRCNMCCDHCLRGMAQNLDIIVLPDHVFFTGGEPFLNVKAINSYLR